MKVEGSKGWIINPLYEPAEKHTINSSYKNAVTPENIGISTDSETMEIGAKKAAKAEGTTLNKIGNVILRGLAGLTGGVLYGTTFLVGGALNLVMGLPIFLVAAPTALIGAGLGAVLGAAISNSTAKEVAKKGAVEGAKWGGCLGFFATGILPAITAVMWQSLLYDTVGKLGAGLCAFAATGKKEASQLKGDKFQTFLKNDQEVRKKSTYEKLLDKLCIISFPYLLPDFEEENFYKEGKFKLEDEFIFKDYRDPSKPMLSKKVDPSGLRG